MGGPWVPGMVDTPRLYREAGGVGLALPFPQLSAVEKEILDAGAMTLSIRKVVMEPGSRIVATDPYPTLRMVEDGQLKWGFLPAGSAPQTEPKTTLTAGRFDRILGVDPTDGHIVLSNSSTKPVEFVEWAVAPAPSVRP